jgi:hypothetical protein
MKEYDMSAKFPLGQTMATPGALEALMRNEQSPSELMTRHVQGDWGDLCDDDRQSNERALEHGGRIFSAYVIEDGTKLWIITEADRSATTILLPEEY